MLLKNSNKSLDFIHFRKGNQTKISRKIVDDLLGVITSLGTEPFRTNVFIHINPFQPSVAFVLHCKTNDWFLCKKTTLGWNGLTAAITVKNWKA